MIRVEIAWGWPWPARWAVHPEYEHPYRALLRHVPRRATLGTEYQNGERDERDSEQVSHLNPLETVTDPRNMTGPA